MRISCVKVNNYRNIDGIEVTFNPECNYIIGENNLGKSNFLSLLATVCNGKGFDEKDFADPEKPIEVELDIKLLPNEQGFFGDNLSPEDASLLKIRYHQTVRDAYPTIVSADSNESIPPRQLRKLNFLKYETNTVRFADLHYTFIYLVARPAPIRFTEPVLTIAPRTASMVVGLTSGRILQISALDSGVRLFRTVASTRAFFVIFLPCTTANRLSNYL